MSGPALSTRIEPIGALAAHLEAWRALAATSLDANPFYAPAFLLALARHLAPHRALRALTVWHGEVLVGLMPIHSPSLRDGFVGGVIGAYAGPFTCLGTPLLARDCVEDALAAMLARLDAAGARALSLPLLPGDSATARALAGVLAREGRASLTLEETTRPCLAPAPGTGLEAYIARESASTRKALRRRAARLEALGATEYHVHAAPGPARAAALARFLALEAAGWKGRRGTALAMRPETRTFMQEAFGPESGLDFEIEELTLAGEPLAMSLNLGGGATLHTYKQAFDENRRALGPGKLLDRACITRALAASPPLTYDSCALMSHPVAEVWHERRVITHHLVALHGQNAALAPLAARHARIMGCWARLRGWREALRAKFSA